MAGARKDLKRAQTKKNPILLLVLLLRYGLIKIGQLPLLVITLPARTARALFVRANPSRVWSKRRHQKVAIKNTRSAPRFVLFYHRRRGRPRKLPLHIYLSRKFKRFFKKILPSPLRVGLVLAFIGAVIFVYSLFLILVARDLPSPDKLAQDTAPLTTEFYDRNGKLLYRLYEGRNRTLVNLSDIPQNLINATVATEDKNFWGHNGVDFYGVMRALISDVEGKEVQGGSTITQQLIKNTLLTTDRTWQRKVKEVLLSFWAERLFNKQQILQMYFNQVAYGGPAWGTEAAAQTYFGKHSKELDLAESAFLAGLPAAPTTYSPYGIHPELGLERQQEVLRRMVEDGYITQDQANQAQQEKLTFKPQISTIKAPHFVMYARELLAQKYGERTVSQGGLKVYTSLDLDTQDMVQNAVSNGLSSLPDSMHITNGAAMVEDPRTGQILAMVGSKDYWDPTDGNFNVTLANRQPGSSIKPITYATAFKQGYSPGTVIVDAPITFTNPWGQSYTPVNYDGQFHGAVTIREALASSFNVPAVKTLNMVGIPNMIKTAHSLGITTLNDTGKYGLSLTLGAGEVRMIDMMTVYSTFAQMGIRHDPNPILKVLDSNGLVLEDDTQDDGTRVLPSGVAYMIDSILSDNNARAPEFGLNSSLFIPNHTVAAKTGTTNDVKDNWTFGFTPNVAVGVWVGNNDNSPMNQSLVSGITGAAPVWNSIMTNLLSTQPDIAFTKPSDVGMGMVDGHQDLVLIGQPRRTATTPEQISESIKFSDQSGQISR